MTHLHHHHHHRRQKPLRSVLAVAAVGGVAFVVPASATTVSAIDAPSGVFFYEPFDNVPIGDQDDAAVVLNGNLGLTWGDSTFEGAVDENNELDTFETQTQLRGAATLELSAGTAGDIDDVIEVLSLPMGSFPVGPLTVTPYIGANLRFSGHAEAGARASIVAPFTIEANFDLTATGSETGSQRFRPEIGLPDLAGAAAFDVSVTVELSITFMISVNDIPVGGPTLNASMGATLVVELQDDQVTWDLDGIGVLRAGWARAGADGTPVPPRLDRMLVLSRLVRADLADGTLPGLDSSTRWARTYDDVSSEMVAAVAPAGEGDLVVHQAGPRPWLATLNGSGNEIWQQRGPDIEFSQALARTAAGDLVSLAGSGGAGIGGFDLERYSSDNTPRWSRTFAPDNLVAARWTGLVAIAEDVVAVGVVTDLDSVSRLAVIRVDAGGNEVWTTKVDLGPGTTAQTADGVAVAPNGDLLIVATGESDADPSLDQYDAVIVRLDAAGGIVRANVLGGGFADWAMDIAVQPDGTYAVSGWTTVDAGHGAWVASFEADDTLRWSATYADGLDPVSNWGEASGVTAVDGGYVIGGRSLSPTGDMNGWVMRIDEAGMPVWAKSYVGTGYDEFVGVVALPTGDRLMPGGVVAYGGTNTGTVLDAMWLVRTNVDGMVASLPDSGFTTVNGRVRWTPSDAHMLLPLAPNEIPATVQFTDSNVGQLPAQIVNVQVGG